MCGIMSRPTRPEFFAALKDWLAIPSISADPAHHADVARSADWLAGYLRQIGFPIVEDLAHR